MGERLYMIWILLKDLARLLPGGKNTKPVLTLLASWRVKVLEQCLPFQAHANYAIGKQSASNILDQRMILV